MISFDPRGLSPQEVAESRRQHGDNVIKCFVDRDISEKLSVGQTVGMHIGKHTVFDK